MNNLPTIEETFENIKNIMYPERTLKDCPFCGSHVQIIAYEDNNDSSSYFSLDILCEKCNIIVSNKDYLNVKVESGEDYKIQLLHSKQKLINHWNTRI